MLGKVCRTMAKATLRRYQAFWNRQETDRPLLGINLGMFANDRCPATMAAVPDGPLQPEDVPIEAFLADCDRLYEAHKEVGDDYPFVAAPFIYIPWAEAIMGCSIVSSPSTIWSEPQFEDWRDWDGKRPSMTGPWAGKLRELMLAMVEHSAGRYQVSGTLVRGPADMMAAMGGAQQLPLGLFDYPDLMKRAVNLYAGVFAEIWNAQHELIPSSPEGYMSGTFRLWAPHKIAWLQADAMALLSPALYREFFLPVDRRLCRQLPAVAFHLHDSSLWGVDELTAIDELAVFEVGFDATPGAEEDTFEACKKAQRLKPLIIWRMYEQPDRFWPWLDRVLRELSPAGLSIEITVADAAEAEEVTSGFLEKARAL